MVARGSMGKYKPGPPSDTQYKVLLAVLALYALGGGYLAGMQGSGGWRWFSYHPFCMTVGFVGLMGGAIVTKKKGGYFNTKMHGIFTWVGLMTALGALYVVYSYKDSNGWGHFKTAHARAGAGVLVSCVGTGMAGGIFLHPDFGIDKTNKQIRLIHKFFSRLVVLAGWFTAVLGLTQMTTDMLTIAMYGLPLLVLVPFVIM